MAKIVFSASVRSAVAVIVLVSACVAGSAMFGPIGAILPLAATAGVLLLGSPRKALLLYWGWVLFAPVAEFLLPQKLLKMLEQGLALFLLTILAGHWALKLAARRTTPAFRIMLTALLGLMGVSALANRVPSICLVHYSVTYLKHIWIFLYALQFLREKDYRTVFIVMMFSFGIQIVFNVAYVVGINPLPRMIGRDFYDAFLGTLYKCHHVGYYMMALIFLLVAYRRQVAGAGRRLCLLMGSLVALIQFYLTYTQHAFPMLIGGLGLQLFVVGRHRLRTFLRSVPFLVATVLVAAVLVSYGPRAENVKRNLSPWALKARWYEARHGLKGQAYAEVFKRVPRLLPYPFLGAGPGNYSSNTAVVHKRPLAMRVMAYKTYGIDYGLIRASASVLGHPSAGILTLWGELGPLGYLLYLGLYVYAAIRVYRHVRGEVYVSPYRRVMAEAFVPMMAVFVLISFLSDEFVFVHLNVGLWIWAACVWNPPEPPVAEKETTGDGGTTE